MKKDEILKDLKTMLVILNAISPKDCYGQRFLKDWNKKYDIKITKDNNMIDLINKNTDKG